MASNIASAAMWAAVFTPTADEIAKEIVAEEARLRALEEKAYWEGWDKGCKEKVIQRLRNHEEGCWLMTLNKQPIYRHLSQDDIADLIEKGELRLISLNNIKAIVAEWVDNSRPEAQDPRYLEFQKRFQADMKEGEYRIIR